jgi:argininosuccinate lyase
MKPDKLWGGRFNKPTDPLVEKYTSSLAVDSRLAKYDVIGSIAHAKMLGRCRIVSAAESRALVRGLEKLLGKIEQGRWKINPSCEDVHTQVQQELERVAGPLARKIHTARSRNDQVSLDLRLYCLDAVSDLTQALRQMQRALCGLAGRYKEVIIPGYTHLQRAQPVLLAHHLLAYVEMFQRDAERLGDAKKRIAVLPLGCGALAGTSLPIDRRYVAKLLGFERIAANSMDAVSDRDFALELSCVLASVGSHLSRLAEDGILWASSEFGILKLDDAFATGSSLMPQKKNPDVLELIRGQAGLVLGQVVSLFAVMKGLPLAYNRDLQWDKTCLFDAVDRTHAALAVFARLLSHASIDAKRSSALANDGTLCATDLAELLVRKGVAFRDAHGIVGRMVARAQAQGKRLRDFSKQELLQFSPALDARMLATLSPAGSIDRKRSEGGTGRSSVARQLWAWRKRLGR